MYNNRYMKNEPTFIWSAPIEPERSEVPAQLKRFLELYDTDRMEFGFDPHDKAWEMMEAMKDFYPDATDEELANFAIADAF